MLQQFTWQDFLIAALVLTLVWYAVIALLFYRRELSLLFGQKEFKQPHEPLPHRWEKGTDQLTGEDEDEPDLMGESRMPDGINRVSVEEISFSGGGVEKEDQVGLVPDVLQELKQVFSILSREDGSKKDFTRLVKAVKEKFPKIASSPNIGRINGFITDHAPFHLSPEELENLWD